MKRFAKIALGAVMLAGAATALASPASARVFVGIGGPAYGPAPVCDPYSPAYNPYYCSPGYAAPVIGFGGVFGGGWHGGWHGGGFHGGHR